MFGTDVVAKHAYNTLRERAAITAAIGSPPRIYPTQAAPEGAAFPLLLHYAENAPYNQDVIDSEGLPRSQTIRYVVRFICQGISDAPIRPAAKDALATLLGDAGYVSVDLDGETFTAESGPIGEWPITTVIEGGVMYRQKGFFLSVIVTRV